MVFAACDGGSVVDSPAELEAGVGLAAKQAAEPIPEKPKPDGPIPVPSAFEAVPDVLWPPNNKLVDIAIVDSKGNPAMVKIRGVKVNEEHDRGDIVIGGKKKGTHLQLRATRNGDGDGRVYSIILDGHKAPLQVTVPHDQRDKEKKSKDSFSCPCWTEDLVSSVTWTSVRDVGSRVDLTSGKERAAAGVDSDGFCKSRGPTIGDTDLASIGSNDANSCMDLLRSAAPVK